MTIMTTASEIIKIDPAVTSIYAGVDTHRDTHHVALVDHVGRAVADKEFLATGAGYRQIIGFLHHNGPVDAIGVEGMVMST